MLEGYYERFLKMKLNCKVIRFYIIWTTSLFSVVQNNSDYEYLIYLKLVLFCLLEDGLVVQNTASDK